MVEKLYVKEYLESLKEDQELDVIFVMLLEAMGFHIVTNPKNSKGQSQYGKDVVAIGEGDDSIKYKWYFELKGYADKDINQSTFNKEDGIRESLLEAKDTIYEHMGIPNFEELPVKIVLVHNGVIKENFKPQFNSFIKKNFKIGEFEDWDINILTNLFYKYLFGEYLLTDKNISTIFKRLLIFLDVADYNFEDLKLLFNMLIENYEQKQNLRNREKLFSTINLLAIIILNTCRNFNNLHPAKYCISFLVLNTWRFILENKAEKKKAYLKEFNKLLVTQYKVLNEYFEKTINFATHKDGLFSYSGYSFEMLGYPIRAFEYLDDFVYFLCLCKGIPGYSYDHRKADKATIEKLIQNNSEALHRPILDRHLIPILHLVQFYFKYEKIETTDIDFIFKYLNECFEQIKIRFISKKAFPYVYHHLEPLIEFEATGIKPFNYVDSSSLLLPILFELTAIFNFEDLYNVYKPIFEKEVDFQIAHPNFNTIENFEILFFSKHLHEEYWVESSLKFPDDFESFKKIIKSKKRENNKFRTELSGYGILKILAESFYFNEPFPEDWRCLFDIF